MFLFAFAYAQFATFAVQNQAVTALHAVFAYGFPLVPPPVYDGEIRIRVKERRPSVNLTTSLRCLTNIDP